MNPRVNIAYSIELDNIPKRSFFTYRKSCCKADEAS